MQRVLGVASLLIAGVLTFEAVAGALHGQLHMLGMLLFAAVFVRHGARKLRPKTRFMSEKTNPDPTRGHPLDRS